MVAQGPFVSNDFFAENEIQLAELREGKKVKEMSLLFRLCAALPAVFHAPLHTSCGVVMRQR